MILLSIRFSLMIIAINSIFKEGMILGSVKIGIANFLDDKLGVKWSTIIQKPLWNCIVCMVPWYFLIVAIYTKMDLQTYIEFCLMCMGINAIIDNLLNFNDERIID